MINNHRVHDYWKIQLIMPIKFISYLDTNDFRIMHVISDDDTEIIGDETDFINELFESIFKKYQEGLEKKNEGK